MAVVKNLEELKLKAQEQVLNPQQKPNPELSPVNSEVTGEIKTLEIKSEVTKPSLDDLSDDELIAQINKRNLNISKPELTEEQKLKQQQIEDVERLKYYVENNLVTPDRFNELKSIIASDGLELTKKEFSKS